MASAGPIFGTPQAPPDPNLPTVAFETPVRGHAINSFFGLRRLPAEPRARMHEGVDFAAPTGAPVLATAPGRVVQTGNSPTYGRFVELRHPNGVNSFYAHLSRVDAGVRPGAEVAGGERLGGVGSTGRSTGSHLHFEIRREGRKLDPQTFLGRRFLVAEVKPYADGRPPEAG